MGQLFSNKPNDEQNQDLTSSFTEHFKNFKMDSKIISQKTINMIELHLTKGNICNQ
jgi:hypothetical protein